MCGRSLHTGTTVTNHLLFLVLDWLDDAISSWEIVPVPLRALVTGGSGFIGSHLVEALVSCGADVRVLDNLANSTPHNLDAVAGCVEFVEGDIRNESVCQNAAAGRDVI